MDVEAKREGDEIVLTIGGKKRSLDDIDDSKYDPKQAAKDEAELNKEAQGFVVSDNDDTDEPEQQVMVAGATADPVKDYLKPVSYTHLTLPTICSV